MEKSNVSARLDSAATRKLDLLPKATARSWSYLVAEAIETYVENQVWQIEAIEEAINEAKQGKFGATNICA